MKDLGCVAGAGTLVGAAEIGRTARLPRPLISAFEDRKCGWDNQRVRVRAAGAGIEVEIPRVRWAWGKLLQWGGEDGRTDVGEGDDVAGDGTVNTDRVGWRCREGGIDGEVKLVVVRIARRGGIDAFGDLIGTLGEALRGDVIGVGKAEVLLPEGGKCGAV